MPPSSLPCRTVQSRPIDDPDPAVHAHRRTCPDCQGASKPLQAAWDALELVADREPSPRFAARVKAKIERAADRSRFSALPWLGSRALRWTALAGGLAVVVLVTSLLVHQERRHTPANGSDVVAELDLLESQDLLQDLEVVEHLDLLLLMDEG